MSVTDLVVWGIIAHLVADWLLQNDWMAQNKRSLAHPAAWIHGLIHTLIQIPIFGIGAPAIGLFHVFIDTRVPLEVLQVVIGQKRVQQIDEINMLPLEVRETMQHNVIASQVAMWADQVMHIVVIAVVAVLSVV